MRFKIFEDYFLILSADGIHVISTKRMVEKILIPIKKSGSVYYCLSQNGQKKEYPLRELLKLVFKF